MRSHVSKCSQQEEAIASWTKSYRSEEGCLGAAGLSFQCWNCLVPPVTLDRLGREFLLTTGPSNSYTVWKQSAVVNSVPGKTKRRVSGKLKPGHDPVGVYGMCGSLMCFGKISSAFPQISNRMLHKQTRDAVTRAGRPTVVMLAPGLRHQTGVFPMSPGGR